MKKTNIKKIQNAQRETEQFNKRVMKNNQRTKEGKYGYVHPIEPIPGYKNNKRSLGLRKKDEKNKSKLQLIGIIIIVLAILLIIAANYL